MSSTAPVSLADATDRVVRWDVVLAGARLRAPIVARAVARSRARGIPITASAAEDLFDDKVLYAAAGPVGEPGAYPHETLEPGRLQAWLTATLQGAIRNYRRDRVNGHVSIDGLEAGDTLGTALTVGAVGEDDPATVVAHRMAIDGLIQEVPEKARPYFLAAFIRDLPRSRIQASYGWTDDEIKHMRSQVRRVLSAARDGALALIPAPILFRLRARRGGLEAVVSSPAADGLRGPLVAAGAAGGTAVKAVTVAILAGATVAAAGAGIEHAIVHQAPGAAHRPAAQVRTVAPRPPVAAARLAGASGAAVAVARLAATRDVVHGAARASAAERRAHAYLTQLAALHTSLGYLAAGAGQAPAHTTRFAPQSSPALAPAPQSGSSPPVVHGGGSTLNYLGGG